MALRNSIKCVVGRKKNCCFKSCWQFVLVSLGWGSKIHLREKFFLIKIKETFQWAFWWYKGKNEFLQWSRSLRQGGNKWQWKVPLCVVRMVTDFWLPLGVWSLGCRPRTQDGEQNVAISKSGLSQGEVDQGKEVRGQEGAPCVEAPKMGLGILMSDFEI